MYFSTIKKSKRHWIKLIKATIKKSELNLHAQVCAQVFGLHVPSERDRCYFNCVKCTVDFGASVDGRTAELSDETKDMIQT